MALFNISRLSMTACEFKYGRSHTFKNVSSTDWRTVHASLRSVFGIVGEASSHFLRKVRASLRIVLEFFSFFWQFGEPTSIRSVDMHTGCQTLTLTKHVPGTHPLS